MTELSCSTLYMVYVCRNTEDVLHMTQCGSSPDGEELLVDP